MKSLKKLLVLLTLGLIMTSVNVLAADINTHVGGTGRLNDINNQYQIQSPVANGVTFKDTEWNALKAGKYDVNFQLQGNIEFSLNWKGPDFTLSIQNSQFMLPTDNWKLVFFVDNKQYEEHIIVPGNTTQQYMFNTVNSNAKLLRVDVQLNGKTVATKDLTINDDYGFNPATLNITLDEKKSYHFNVSDEVLVEYFDTLGNPLSKDDIMIEDYSDNYTTKPKSITGYSLVKVEGNENGVYDTSKHIIKYIYEKNEAAQGLVNVHYQDISGNPIALDEQITGAVGSSYSTGKKEIKGYTYKEVRGDASGKFTTNVKNIYYIYEKVVEKPVIKENGGEELPPLNQKVEESKAPVVVKEQTAKNEVSPDKKVLPETGSSDNSLWIVILGGVLVIISISFSLLKRVKN